MFNAKKEKEKLERIISKIPENQKELVAGLIHDASFMAEQLEKLRAHISKHGVSEEYKNGENQYGKKPSVEADMYVKMLKLYASVIKQLSEYLPRNSTSEGSDLLAFLERGKGQNEGDELIAFLNHGKTN